MSNDIRPSRVSKVWQALQATATAMTAMLAMLIAMCQFFSLGAFKALEHRIEQLEQLERIDQQRPYDEIFNEPIVWPPGQNTDPVPWCWPQGRENRGQSKGSSIDDD